MGAQLRDAVRLTNVRKVFTNVVAVDDLSIAVPVGSIYGFLGPNGAGKSTTIRMLMGILRADAGTICVLGSEDPAQVKPRLGYLPEEKGLYKKMRVAELVRYFARLKGLDKRTAEERASALLDEYALGDWKNEKCESLSKGMGQKVQILSTLIHEPDLVVLDEPFSGLDPINVELVRNTILDLKRSGRTVVFSTHMMEQAERLCDSVLLINRGRKVIDGPTNTVRAEAGDTVVLDYDGDGSVLHALDGVARVNDAGKHAELTLQPGTDAQSILSALVPKLRIHRFDTSSASLHEIFVRAVGPQVLDGQTADGAVDVPTDDVHPSDGDVHPSDGDVRDVQ